MRLFRNTARNPLLSLALPARTLPISSLGLGLPLSLSPPLRLWLAQAVEQRRQVVDAAGDHMAYLPLSLQAAVDAQQPADHDLAAVFVKDFGPDDDIGCAAVVLQRQKDDAASGLRPLSGNDQAGHG